MEDCRGRPEGLSINRVLGWEEAVNIKFTTGFGRVIKEDDLFSCFPLPGLPAALANLIPVHARQPLMSTLRRAQPPPPPPPPPPTLPILVQGGVQGVVRLIDGGRGIHAINLFNLFCLFVCLSASFCLLLCAVAHVYCVFVLSIPVVACCFRVGCCFALLLLIVLYYIYIYIYMWVVFVVELLLLYVQ